MTKEEFYHDVVQQIKVLNNIVEIGKEKGFEHTAVCLFAYPEIEKGERGVNISDLVSSNNNDSFKVACSVLIKTLDKSPLFLIEVAEHSVQRLFEQTKETDA